MKRSRRTKIIATLGPASDSPEMIGRLPFYDSFYVRHLTHQVRRHQHYFPHLPRPRRSRRVRE